LDYAERETPAIEAFIDMPLANIDTFVDGLNQSHLLDAEQREEVARLQLKVGDSRELAQELLRRDWLTAYQVNQLLQGKGAGLTIGPFLLLERIGEGGMGQVFKARQKMLNRVVALKVIRKECLGNPKIIQRFQREIRAAGQLSHPHIVRAFDADQVNGIYYIAMEFIEGVDLAKLVKDNGPLDVDQACEYIRQAALGLQHAHERGLVHRDLKPANLLVTRGIASDRRCSSGLIKRPLDLNAQRSGVMSRADAAKHYPWGVVKILDLGLARCTEAFVGSTATHLTQVGSVMGTPEFIAPEQARDSHTSDIRADLYSLGCTLYFLLTGEPPFPKGTLTEKLLQHQFDEAQPVARIRRENLLAWKGATGPANASKEMLHVPAVVDQLIRRLLSKGPEDRCQTPNELANELQAILQKLAAGTLASDEATDLASPQTFAPVVVMKTSVVSMTVVQPIVLLNPPRARPRKLLAKLSIALATLGGLAFVVLITGFAAILSRGAHTRAGMRDADPPMKPSKAVEPNWKKIPPGSR
jgi:serine/threonine protein kinase